MARIPEARRAEGRRATERAKAALKAGDRLLITRCGGSLPTVTFVDFDPLQPEWIRSKTLDDIHALHIRKVNGEPTTFADTITIGRRTYRRFIYHPQPVDDGTVRCFRCGQIDEPEHHDNATCDAALT